MEIGPTDTSDIEVQIVLSDKINFVKILIKRLNHSEIGHYGAEKNPPFEMHNCQAKRQDLFIDVWGK